MVFSNKKKSKVRIHELEISTGCFFFKWYTTVNIEKCVHQMTWPFTFSWPPYNTSTCMCGGGIKSKYTLAYWIDTLLYLHPIQVSWLIQWQIQGEGAGEWHPWFLLENLSFLYVKLTKLGKYCPRTPFFWGTKAVTPPFLSAWIHPCYFSLVLTSHWFLTIFSILTFVKRKTCEQKIATSAYCIVPWNPLGKIVQFNI